MGAAACTGTRETPLDAADPDRSPRVRIDPPPTQHDGAGPQRGTGAVVVSYGNGHPSGTRAERARRGGRVVLPQCALASVPR